MLDPFLLVGLAVAFFLNDLVRTALMTVATRSVAVHLAICALTLAPSVAIAALLIVASLHSPGVTAGHLGLAAALHVPWWAGGAATRLVRRDSEGADVGWIAVGFTLATTCGVLAAAFGA